MSQRVYANPLNHADWHQRALGILEYNRSYYPLVNICVSHLRHLSLGKLKATNRQKTTA